MRLLHSCKSVNLLHTCSNPLWTRWKNFGSVYQSQKRHTSHVVNLSEKGKSKESKACTGKKQPRF